jgi:hypothetical protein
MYAERLTYQLRRRFAGIRVKQIQKDLKTDDPFEFKLVSLMALASEVSHRVAEL